MASPQTENGYIQLATEIVDALAGIRISGEEMQCLWVVLRKTYGWGKKEDWISLSQFTELTSIKKPNVVRALSRLVDKNIVIKKDNSRGVSYGFQKNYLKWKPLSKKITLSKKIKPVIKKDKAPLSKKIPTIDTTTKDIITKDNKDIFFEEMWSRYPKRDGKKGARNHFNASVKVVQDWENINKALDNYISHVKDTEKRYIKNGSTWFNNWEDWIEPEEDEGKNSFNERFKYME